VRLWVPPLITAPWWVLDERVTGKLLSGA